MQDNPPRPSAARQLGFTSATALVVASMVGTGVFTTSGFLLADLGTARAVLMVWAAGGILAGLGALNYGALARRIPESGGEYLFLSRTLHPAAGYLAGWVSLLVGFSAPLAAVAFAFGEYTKDWLPLQPPQLTGTLLLVACSAVHATHVRRGAWVQTAAVFLKVALILGVIGYALGRMPALAVPVTAPAPMTAYGAALVFVSFSYSGWNAAVYVAGEVTEPERTLPRALLAGAGIVTVLYLGLNTVFLYAAPVEQLAGQVDVARIAAHALGGRVFADALSAVIALALFTSASSLIMAGPRVYAKMADDGYLPKWFASTTGPPRTAILLQLVLAVALLWSATYDSLLTYVGFTLGLSTAATVVGLVVLRRREGATAVPVPGWPWVPAAFLVIVVAITASTIVWRPVESLAGFATLAVGAAAWFLSRRSRSRAD